MNNPKIIISGGGTGGHIFPALAIANEMKRRHPLCSILFVGALGKMEMSRVPDNGYDIVGLPIRGLDRARPWRNIVVLLRLLQSLFLAYRTVRRFAPDIVVGVGGYASGPVLWVAQMLSIPTLIQEQNSYAGLANKLLAKRASAICVAYPSMERFFPPQKIILTGNPIRSELFTSPVDRNAAFESFGLDPAKPTILLLGGSLGARTLNECVKQNYPLLSQHGVQLLWQCGGYYREEMQQFVADHPYQGVKLVPFIDRMEQAFAVADLIISRSGASSVSEFCQLGKPVVLVPSPNVAEDHQTYNAKALSDRGAALLVTDADAVQTLLPTAINLLNNPDQRNSLSQEIVKLALPNAAQRLVVEIDKLVR